MIGIQNLRFSKSLLSGSTLPDRNPEPPVQQVPSGGGEARGESPDPNILKDRDDKKKKTWRYSSSPLLRRRRKSCPEPGSHLPNPLSKRSSGGMPMKRHWLEMSPTSKEVECLNRGLGARIRTLMAGETADNQYAEFHWNGISGAKDPSVLRVSTNDRKKGSL